MTDNRRLWTEAKDRLVRAVVSLGFRVSDSANSMQITGMKKKRGVRLASM